MFSLFVFLLGLVIGSFLEVLSDRLPKEEQVVKGRSHCDHCRKRLSPLDLIPVLSYFLLLGKCRYCKKGISIKYPLVELATGLGFAYIFLNLKIFALPSPSLISLVFLWFIFSCFLVIFMADLQYLIIPNAIVIPAAVLSITYYLIYFPQFLLPHLLAACGSSLFLLLLYAITRGRGMGFGDVKFAFLMGLLLGFPEVVIAFYLAFLTGAVVGIILLLIGKVRFGQYIAFGPFLVIATIIVLVCKEKLLSLFLKFLF